MDNFDRKIKMLYGSNAEHLGYSIYKVGNKIIAQGKETEIVNFIPYIAMGRVVAEYDTYSDDFRLLNIDTGEYIITEKEFTKYGKHILVEDTKRILVYDSELNYLGSKEYNYNIKRIHEEYNSLFIELEDFGVVKWRGL